MKVPEKCFGCGSPFVDGPVEPNEPVQTNSKTTFECGATLLVRDVDGETKSVFKNCPKYARKR